MKKIAIGLLTLLSVGLYGSDEMKAINYAEQRASKIRSGYLSYSYRNMNRAERLKELRFFIYVPTGFAASMMGDLVERLKEKEAALTDELMKRHLKQYRDLCKQKRDMYFKVIDQDGNPAEGMKINANGESFDGKSYTSDSNGMICFKAGPLLFTFNKEESLQYYRDNSFFDAFEVEPVVFDENDDLVLDSYGTTEENPFIIKVTRRKNPSPNVDTDLGFLTIINNPFCKYKNWENNVLSLNLEGKEIYKDENNKEQIRKWKTTYPLTLQVELGGWDNSYKDIGNSRRVFARDVKVTVTLKGGGFVRNTKRFNFTAPELGYQETLVFDIKAGTRYKDARYSYFVKYPNGMYGTFDFTIEDEQCLYFGSYNMKVGDRNVEGEGFTAGSTKIGFFEDDDQYPQFLDINELRMDNDPRYYTPVE